MIFDEVEIAMRTVAHARGLALSAAAAFEEPSQVLGQHLCFRVQVVLPPLNSLSLKGMSVAAPSSCCSGILSLASSVLDASASVACVQIQSIIASVVRH